MRKYFTKGQTITLQNMYTGEIIKTQIERSSGRSFYLHGPRIYGKLKYYKNLKTYTVSEGMTNGKCNKSNRWILVEETA